MAVKQEIPIAVLVQYFRVPTGDVPVDYPGREVLLGSRITNISNTGVFIRTSNPLPKGTELDIAFHLPNVKTEIKATVVVRWSSEIELSADKPHRNAAVGMGLEYVHISPRHRKLVIKFIEDFLSRMRKE